MYQQDEWAMKNFRLQSVWLVQNLQPVNKHISSNDTKNMTSTRTGKSFLLQPLRASFCLSKCLLILYHDGHTQGQCAREHIQALLLNQGRFVP